MRRRRLRCASVVELVTDYLEDALAPSLRSRVDHHLDGCRHCRVYLAQLRATIRLTSLLA